MLTRALIVLLVALNLGVAAWWLWRPEPPAPVAEDELPSGIARLRLVQEPASSTPRAQDADLRAERDAPPGEAGEATTATTAQADPETAQPATPADIPVPAAKAVDAPAPPATEAQALRCYRIGPYPDDLARTAALPALRPLATTLRSRDTRAGAGRGWRVQVPPATDAQTARAMAERVRAAGFTDYFVVADGPEAHAIALGRFSNEERARQHAAALNAAGFPAQAEALGESRPQYWVDVAATAQAGPADLRAAAGGAEVRVGACPDA